MLIGLATIEVNPMGKRLTAKFTKLINELISRCILMNSTEKNYQFCGKKFDVKLRLILPI